MEIINSEHHLPPILIHKVHDFKRFFSQNQLFKKYQPNGFGNRKIISRASTCYFFKFKLVCFHIKITDKCFSYFNIKNYINLQDLL